MSIGKTVKKTIYGILLVSFFLVCFMQSVSFATGDVTGFITAASGGAGISGLYVNAYDAVTGAYIKASPASAATTGAYTISGLTPGNYKIMCRGTQTSGNFSAQYYPNTGDIGSATPVTVTEGGTAPGINFSLVPGGAAVTGTITAASGGAGLSGLLVYAYDAATNAYIKDGSASAVTTGLYTIWGLTPGTYAIKFRGNTTYAQQYYNNTFGWNWATPVTVVVGAPTTNINFSLVTGGNISGTISAGSSPVSGVYVYAYDAATGIGSYGSSSVSALDGSYTISGLLPGSYKVRFNGNATYGQQYYNNAGNTAANTNEATWVTVTAGVTTASVNLGLVPGANISGTITRASDGQPVQGVSVSILDAVTGAGGFSGSSTTGADGTYTIYGLPSGSYKLRTNPNNTGLATQWYSNAPNQNSATPLTVTAGIPTAGINFSLGTGGNISGTITRASDGQPVPGVNVHTNDFTTNSYVTTGSMTAADGSYTIYGLAPGNYRPRVNAGNTGLTSQYYLNANYYTSTPVAVTSGLTTTNINFNVPAGASISGIVTRASDGQPIADLLVRAYSTAANGGVDWNLAGTTQYDGSYTITGLPAGTYKVAIDPIGSQYATQFYPGASNHDMAELLTVTTGNTPNINFSLGIGGKISGTIRDAVSHLTLPGLWVSIYHARTGENVSLRAQTDANGQYTTAGLPPGYYRIYVSGTGDYISTNYNNAFLSSAATPVAVTVGNTTTNKDIDLTSGAGTITGYVRDAGSQPVAGMIVAALNHLEQVKSTTTAYDGSYSIAGLPPDNAYTVLIEPSNKDYATVYYPDAHTQETAALISIAAGQTRSGIDFTVYAGGSVSGVVTSSPGGQPLSGMRVKALDPTTGNAVVNSVNTQYDGSYTLTGLPAGTYKIRVNASTVDRDNQYVAQYYDNVVQRDLATSVSVTAGQTTTGINFSLPLGGKISGVVRSAANGDPVSSLIVQAYDPSTGSMVAAGATTIYDGSYVLTGLPAGSYAVRVTARGIDYATMYYNGVTDIAFATPVSVTVGNTHGGIDFNLLSAGIKNDFNSDNKPDILWRNPTTGDNYVWFMNGTTFTSSALLFNVASPWEIVGTADFNADNKPDILWRNPTTGDNYVWFMDGTTFTGSSLLFNVPAPWEIVGANDFNSDNKPDILWRNPTTGDNYVWFMDGTNFTGSALLFTVPAPWEIVGTADFNADNKPDILWRNPTTGDNYVWFMDGTNFASSALLFNVASPWEIVGTNDFNADNKPDILWRNPTTGDNYVWFMNGTTFTSSALLFNVASPWEIVGR
jgi:hypothetical protein